MPLVVNMRHLEAHSVVLKGKLPVDELEIDPLDEVIQVAEPLEHDLEVQKIEDGLLMQGRLHLRLECECVRCLKPFQHHIDLKEWACHLPLEGDERVAIVNDCVDLTPFVREDILLEFPQHPLCDPECRGLPKTSVGKPANTNITGPGEAGSSAWAELNKLKL
jgi:uncharacterized protein